MRTTGHILMLTAGCLMAASFIGPAFIGPAAFAQNAEAEAAAAAASAAAAAGRANAQVSPNDSLEKICRVGPRSREVEIQKIEPFKVFDNLYHVGPCYVSAWILTTPQGDIMFDTSQEPFVDKAIVEALYAQMPDGELLSRLGARNVLTPELGPFPKLNPEYVVRHNPDVIFVSDCVVETLVELNPFAEV